MLTQFSDEENYRPHYGSKIHALTQNYLLQVWIRLKQSSSAYMHKYDPCVLYLACDCFCYFSSALWGSSESRLPSCDLQPPESERDAALYCEAAAVRWPDWPAGSGALHSVPTASGPDLHREWEHRFRTPAVLLGRVRLLQLRDGCGLPVSSFPLPELVWEWTDQAVPLGSRALPKNLPQQVGL